MIKPLTSLRFFFALAVFLHHYIVGDSAIFANGFIGVSFFFILSGFILSYSYKDRLFSGKTSIWDFYVARFARIYPLHLLTFLAFIPLLVYTNSVPNWKVLFSNLFLFQSWSPYRNWYFSVNFPSWSISDEAFFYAVFPVLLYFFMKKSCYAKTIAIAVCLLVYAVSIFYPWEQYQAHALFYVNPLFRLVDFGIGIVLYSIWDNYSQKKYNINKLKATILEIGSIGILIFMIWFSKYIPKTFTYACYYWLPMSAIIYLFAIQQKGFVTILLSKKVLVLLGEISYAFYMFHIPVIRYSDAIIKKISETGWQIHELTRFIIVFTAIFTISFLSFHYFETPINRKIKGLFKKYKLKHSLR